MGRRRAFALTGLTVVAASGLTAWQVAGASGPRSTANEWLRANVDTGAVERVAAPGAFPQVLDGSLLEDVDGDGGGFRVVDLGGRPVSGGALRPPAHPMHGVVLAPVGTRIAYVRFVRTPGYEHPYGALVVATRPGARGRALLRRALEAPAFSPDGERLVVLQAAHPDAEGVPGTKDIPTRLVVVRADGRGRPRTLARDAQSGPAAPVWLSDRRIAYVAFRGIVVLGPGPRRVVLARGADVESLAISGDGERALYAVRDAKGYHLAISRLDGRGEATTLDADHATFSPSGSRLAAVTGDHITLVRATGEPMRSLPSTHGREIHQVAWSRDERFLLFHAVPPTPPGE